MPRSEHRVRLVPLSEALEALGGISEDTFRRHWQPLFTPRNSSGANAGQGRKRFVYSDELEAAVRHGPAAVATVRKRQKRL